MSGIKYFHPVNRLRELMVTPGGKSQAQALSDAREGLDERREEAQQGLTQALDAIDATLARSDGSLSPEDLYGIVQNTERLACIAASYDMTLMMRVTASFGALGSALLDAQTRPYHHILVHARAARWAAENAHLSEEEAAPLLNGLLRVAERASGQFSG